MRMRIAKSRQRLHQKWTTTELLQDISSECARLPMPETMAKAIVVY